MNLQERFQRIKELFFPDWDQENLWLVDTSSERSERDGDGCCDHERRVIEIVCQSTDPNEQDLLLIHEICHVFFPGHEKDWQDRMGKAARRADEIGQHQLAHLLRKEIDDYRRSPSCSKQEAHFYDNIRSAVEGIPDLTLPRPIALMADELRLDESEVCKIYPQTELVFREAKLDAGPDSTEIK